MDHQKKFTTIAKILLIFAAVLSAQEKAGAADAHATENLTPFLRNAGDYVIDAGSGPYCTKGYTALNIAIDPGEQTVTATFTGPGEIHGYPTAGREQIRVSLTDTIDLPSFPGSKKQRTVVVGDTILNQTWSWSPLAGEFGGWKNAGQIVRFVGGNRLITSRGGFVCPFLRTEKLGE